MYQYGTENADGNFLHAQGCDVENRTGIKDAGEADQACGVACKNEGIGAGRAIKQRKEQAQTNPAREDEAA